jgi:hypothetical protein
MPSVQGGKIFVVAAGGDDEEDEDEDEPDLFGLPCAADSLFCGKQNNVRPPCRFDTLPVLLIWHISSY